MWVAEKGNLIFQYTQETFVTFLRWLQRQPQVKTQLNNIYHFRRLWILQTVAALPQLIKA